VPDVSDLEDEESEPDEESQNVRRTLVGSVRASLNTPVERGDGCIHSKRCGNVLSPDGVSPSEVIIVGNIEGVVEADYEVKKPGDDSSDLVGPHSLDGMGIPTSKRVVYDNISSAFSLGSSLVK
jgi:hypothetical protein